MAIDKVTYWIGIADYDLETADAMFITKRWLYVAFMCHQAIEKTLKAYWCATLPEDPPYTHSHKRLADGCGLYSRMSKDQKDFINTVTNYNIEARYPEDKDEQDRDIQAVVQQEQGPGGFGALMHGADAQLVAYAVLRFHKRFGRHGLGLRRAGCGSVTGGRYSGGNRHRPRRASVGAGGL